MKTQKKDPTIEESNQDLITEGFKKGPFTDNSTEDHIAEKIKEDTFTEESSITMDFQWLTIDCQEPLHHKQPFLVFRLGIW